MAIKTIFLDRDGVINEEVKYLHTIKEFIFIKGIFEACQHFKKLGYEIIIVTNQSGIARKYYQESDYQKLTSWMLAQFLKNNVEILEVLHCPHSPSSNCDCRKPKSGMFIQAINKYNTDIKNSWMIGDKEDDIKAANAAGIKNTILVRSGHKINETESNAKIFLDSIYESIKVIIS